MTDRTESGRYALAGFLYQIVGSGVEGLQIVKCEKNDDDNEILELEQLGQDLIGHSTDDAGGIRLIQFKYSSTSAIVKPSEMRKLLETFLACVCEAHKNVDKCSYELRTNRVLHPDLENWFRAKEDKACGKLRDAIKATSQSGKVQSLDKICKIFERFTYRHQTASDLQSELDDAAANLGMLKGEIPGGVNRLVGFLAIKSAEPGERRVLPAEIQAQFAGHPNAIELLSEKSIEIRRKDIDDFQQDEASKSAVAQRARIITRTKIDDIVLALLQYPVVVVEGYGGCGKSIAVADALLSCLQDQHQPPGFGLIVRAEATNRPIVISKIAAWRNCSNHTDGTDFLLAFRRLKAAYANSPALVICFDAIDEKQGEALPEETLVFIRELIRLAVDSRAQNGNPLVSVILTCRHRREVENIPRNLNPIAPENYVSYIRIEDYDNDELKTAIRTFNGLSKEFVRRIEETLDALGVSVAGSKGKSVDISSEVIELLRHPVLLYIYSQLTFDQQRECLTGSQQALQSLGKDYLKWFRKKAACRIMNLNLGQCAEALCAASKTFADVNDIGFLDANWLQPATDSIGNRWQAKLLYDEAISAGLILEIERKQSWRWRHPWFCNFLLRSEGDLL